MRIQPIVEGHGEVAALPVLLRRLRDEAEAWGVDIARPIRRTRHQLARAPDVERAVRLALLQPACAAILIVFDGDRDCPATLGPEVQVWATAAAAHVPCQVVIAHREYEAWFLAAAESLRGHGLRLDAPPHPEPEEPRGAKEELERRMPAGASYLERIDQPAFSYRFSLPAAHRHSRSFRKLVKSFGNLVRSLDQKIAAWPPESWSEDTQSDVRQREVDD